MLAVAPATFRPMIRMMAMLLALALLGAACGGKNTPAATTVTAAELHGQDWTVTTLGPSTAPLPGTVMTLSFGNPGEVSGKAGCNSFSGSYTATGGSLTFDQLAMTRMGCEPDVMAQEDAFSKALADTRSATVAGDVLTLKDASGETVMVCQRVVPA